MAVSASPAPWRTSLWDYALGVYANKDVESAVLELQDNYCANVNIILWLCWLDEETLFLSRSLLDDVLISVDSVSQATLVKLREARRYIKNGEAFTEVQARLVLKQLLSAELMIEKILIHRLQEFTRCNRSQRFEQEPLGLSYYLEFLGIPRAREQARSVSGACRAAYSRSVNSKIYQTAHPPRPNSS